MSPAHVTAEGMGMSKVRVESRVQWQAKFRAPRTFFATRTEHGPAHPRIGRHVNFELSKERCIHLAPVHLPPSTGNATHKALSCAEASGEQFQTTPLYQQLLMHILTETPSRLVEMEPLQPDASHHTSRIEQDILPAKMGRQGHAPIISQSRRPRRHVDTHV